MDIHGCRGWTPCSGTTSSVAWVIFSVAQCVLGSLVTRITGVQSGYSSILTSYFAFQSRFGMIGAIASSIRGVAGECILTAVHRPSPAQSGRVQGFCTMAQRAGCNGSQEAVACCGGSREYALGSKPGNAKFRKSPRHWKRKGIILWISWIKMVRFQCQVQGTVKFGPGHKVTKICSAFPLRNEWVANCSLASQNWD